MFCISDVFEIWLYTCILFVFHRWPWNIWLDLDLFVLTLTCWIFPFNLFVTFSLFTCDELTIYMSISWLIFCEICFIFMQFYFKRKLMLDFFFPNWMTYILLRTFIALTWTYVKLDIGLIQKFLNVIRITLNDLYYWLYFYLFFF